MRRNIVVLLSVIGAVGLVVACGGDDTSTPAIDSGTPDTNSQKPDTSTLDSSVADTSTAADTSVKDTSVPDSADAAAPPFMDLTFDDVNTTYTLTPFGGEAAVTAADPNNAQNNTAKLTKHVGDQTWAGTTISTGANNSIPTLPVTAMRTKASIKFYSPVANVPVRIKIEDAADPTHSVETQVTAGAANTWQTLQFDFTVPTVPPTAPLNPAYTFNKVSVFVNFNNQETGSDKVYYVDDVVFY